MDPKKVSIVMGSQTLTGTVQADPANSGTILVLDSTTLTEGGAPAAMSGQTVSLGSNAVVVGSSKIPIATATFDFESHTSVRAGHWQMDALSGDPAADPVTVAFSTPNGDSNSPPDAVLTLGSEVVTAIETTAPDGSTIAIWGSNILTAGGHPKTISGYAMSIGPEGLVVGSLPMASKETITFSSLIGDTTSPPDAVFTLGSDIVTAVETTAPDGSTIAVLGSKTLVAGGAAMMMSGYAVSLGPQGFVIAADPSNDPHAPQTSLDGAVFVLGTSTVTASEQPGPGGVPVVDVGSRTLTVGGPAETVGGETVSAASGGVVVDGTMHSFSLISQQTGSDYVTAGAMMSSTGAGSDPAASTQDSLQTGTGHAAKGQFRGYLFGLGVMMTAWVMLLTQAFVKF